MGERCSGSRVTTFFFSGALQGKWADRIVEEEGRSRGTLQIKKSFIERTLTHQRVLTQTESLSICLYCIMNMVKMCHSKTPYPFTQAA